MKNNMVFVIRFVYGDFRSSTLGQARVAKWKVINKSTLGRCPDNDSLTHFCQRSNYLAYIQLHSEMKDHPSSIGHGWRLVHGRCRQMRFTQPALPEHLTGFDHEQIEEKKSDDNSDGKNGIIR